MFCPRCGEQYREGFGKCAECGVALVERLPRAVAPLCGGREPEAVFETANTAVLVVAKSLLQGEGIPYFVRGEPLQDLFGWGRFGTGFSPIAGPMEVLVAAEEAGRARELLAGLESGGPPPSGREKDDG
jgi:Putative prokaryotic signal transducing protein